jgi:hypothetical protein
VRPQRRGHAKLAAPRRARQSEARNERAEQRKAAPPAPFLRAPISFFPFFVFFAFFFALFAPSREIFSFSYSSSAPPQ